MNSTTDMPKYSLEECFDWIYSLTEKALPDFGELYDAESLFEIEEYDKCINAVEKVIGYSDFPEKTNEDYLTSFLTHIKVARGNETIDSHEIEDGESEQINQSILPSNLKKLDDNKIASGEIDPTEISYAEFEAAQNGKEIDYKSFYSKLIREGKLDPTKTTYNEMVTISKLFTGIKSSDLKAIYAQHIASGKIDPAGTNYDEIISIVNASGKLKENKAYQNNNNTKTSSATVANPIKNDTLTSSKPSKVRQTTAQGNSFEDSLKIYDQMTREEIYKLPGETVIHLLKKYIDNVSDYHSMDDTDLEKSKGSLYFHPEFYSKYALDKNKVKNARKSYAKFMDDDEVVILQVDDTVFGGADEGMLLTHKGLYFTNPDKKPDFLRPYEFGVAVSNDGFFASTGRQSKLIQIKI